MKPIHAFATCLVVALTVVSGIMYGRMIDRWGGPPDMLAAAKKLEAIPAQIGNWRLQSSHEIDVSTVNLLKCVGYIHRVYVNEQTGQGVQMSVVCGPSGPTSVHTPEICYDSQGHAIKQGPERVTIEDSVGTQQELWTILLEENNVDRNSMVVYYAWSTGDSWLAPENPRLSLSKHDYLFKLQMATPVALGSGVDPADACLAFIQEFAPIAKRHFAPSE